MPMMPLAALPALLLGGALTGGIGAAAPASVTIPGSPLGAGVPLAVTRDADGLFYVMASVDDRPVRFAVDTGASVVVLSGADAARVGIAGAGFSPGIATATGTAAMPVGRAHSLRIGGRSFGPMPVTIAPQGNVSLIGESVLSRYREIRIQGNRMELR